MRILLQRGKISINLSIEHFTPFLSAPSTLKTLYWAVYVFLYMLYMYSLFTDWDRVPSPRGERELKQNKKSEAISSFKIWPLPLRPSSLSLTTLYWAVLCQTKCFLCILYLLIQMEYPVQEVKKNWSRTKNLKQSAYLKHCFFLFTPSSSPPPHNNVLSCTLLD